MVETIASPKRVRVIRTVPAESYGPLDVVAVVSGELLAEQLPLPEARTFCRRWNTEHPAQWAAFQPTRLRKQCPESKGEATSFSAPKKATLDPSEDEILAIAAAIRSERRC